MCLVKHARAVMDKRKVFLCVTYGSGDPKVPVGPFTYRSYCRYMLNHGTWGDDAALFALATEGQLAIMILFSSTLHLYPITDNFSLRNCDILLVHNGVDHFSGTGKCLPTKIMS